MAETPTPAPAPAPSPAPAVPTLGERFNALLKHLAAHGIHFKG